MNPLLQPTMEQVAFFRTNGFVSLPGLLSRSEVRAVAEAFDEAVARVVGRTHGHARVQNHGDDALVTIVSPEASVSSLRSSVLAREAQRVLATLFGVPEDRLLCGWRGFLKPAGGDVTPWHQDAAYRPPPHHGGTVWLPLDHASEESGCLEYLPGSHRGPVRPHSELGHHLVAEPPAGDGVTTCPLAVGDVSVHHCMTLHRATANRRSEPRRALAVVCQVVPRSEQFA